MGKTKNNGLLDILLTGKQLWDEHGDEIKNVASKLVGQGKKKNASVSNFSSKSSLLSSGISSGSKTKKRSDNSGLLNILNAGKQLWDEHGDQIKDIASGVKDLLHSDKQKHK